MAATTVEEYAAALAPIMKTASGATTAAITAALIPVLADFAIGGLSLNRMAALGQKGLQDGDTWRREVAEWANGPANGGPNGDGLYPMTTPDGVVNLWPGRVKLQTEQAAAIAALTAAGAVLKADDYSLDAITYSSMDETGQSAMVDWMKQLDAAGLALPSGERTGILFDAFKGMVDSGCWSKIVTLYPLAYQVSAVSLLNMKNTAAYPLTAINGPSFAADRGWKGGAIGSAARLQTAGGAFPGTPSQNNLCFGGWVTEVPTRGQVIYLGPGTRMIYSGGQMASQINGGAAVTHPLTAGFYAASRGGATDARFQHDDDAQISNATASSANANAFGLLGVPTVSGQESDARLGMSFVSQDMTPGEMGAMRRIWGNYFRDLARAS